MKEPTDTQIEAGLKPCPFCGGRAHLKHFEGLSRLRGWYVVCHGEKLCLLFCSTPYSDALSREEAIERWNHRNNTRLDGDDVERVARAISRMINDSRARAWDDGLLTDEQKATATDAALAAIKTMGE